MTETSLIVTPFNDVIAPHLRSQHVVQNLFLYLSVVGLLHPGDEVAAGALVLPLEYVGFPARLLQRPDIRTICALSNKYT